VKASFEKAEHEASKLLVMHPHLSALIQFQFMTPDYAGEQLTKYISYVDEAGHSKDPHRNYLCLAGLVAKRTAWEEFAIKWSAACAEESLTKPFHMMDFAAFKGEFKGWTEERRKRLLAKLIATIRGAEAIPIGSVVSVKDYNQFDTRVQRRLKDPYFMAFQTLSYNIAVASAMAVPPGTVEMVYALHPEHSKGQGNAGELWEGFRRHNPLIAPFMESYVCGEPSDFVPLQAGDLWAYELAHHFEVIRPARKPRRWPFQQFVEMRLNYEFTHNFISHHDASGVNGLGLMSRVQQLQELSLDDSAT
jgi:hypothetical protein